MGHCQCTNVPCASGSTVSLHCIVCLVLWTNKWNGMVENVWCSHEGREPGTSDGVPGRGRLVDDAPGQHTATVSCQHIPAPPGRWHWTVCQQDARSVLTTLCVGFCKHYTPVPVPVRTFALCFYCYHISIYEIIPSFIIALNYSKWRSWVKVIRPSLVTENKEWCLWWTWWQLIQSYPWIRTVKQVFIVALQNMKQTSIWILFFNTV